MKLHIESIAHHRNGICGAPFHAVLFRDPDEGRMLGVVFGQASHVAVFNLDKLAMGNIAFGVNSWRGDRYEPALRRLIDADRPTEVTETPADAGHSPEPWSDRYDPYPGIRDDAVPAWEILDGDGYTVARRDDGGDPTRQRADSRLVAAAPALLRSLRRAINALNCVPAFRTDEGVSSYRLLPELETVVLQATSPAGHSAADQGEDAHG